MLEMVHYILRFTITMKHVIYKAILSAASGSGESAVNSPSSGNRIWCILAWKSDIWWHQIFIFPDFSKKIFSPDLSLTTEIPWLFPVFPDLQESCKQHKL